MPIPWGVILRQAPMLIGAAEALLASSRRRAADVAAGDAGALGRRLEAIEADQQANAELVKGLTEQVSALAEAAETGARRTRQAAVLAAIAAGLSLLACAIALFS